MWRILNRRTGFAWIALVQAAAVSLVGDAVRASAMLRYHANEGNG
jgi:hypothetical protein